MSWTLIGTIEKEYTPGQIASKVNLERKTNYTNLSIMIAALGLSVVASSFFSSYVTEVKTPVQRTIEAVGFIISSAGIIAALNANNDANELQAVLDRANAYGGTITVTTKSYEYTTGSGNHSTWKTETTYRYNRY